MTTPTSTCELPPVTDQFTPPPVTRHLPPVTNIGPSGKDDFGFKQFQLEDYARGGLHDGLILGHDTGGGKSLALFVWPALKVGFVQPDTFLPGEPRGLKPLAPVLLVVPGDLHHKTIHEDAAMLKAKVTVIDSQATFLRLSTPNPRTGKRELPAGYYLTSYTQLTGNGVTPFPAYDPGNPVGMMQVLGLTDNDSAEYFDCRDSLFDRHYRRLNALPTMTLRELSACLNKEKLKFDSEAIKRELQRSFDVLEPFHCDVYNPSFSDLPPEKKATVRAQMVQVKYEEFAGSIGEERWFGGAPFKRVDGTHKDTGRDFVEFKVAGGRFLAQECPDCWGVFKDFNNFSESIATYPSKEPAVEHAEWSAVMAADCNQRRGNGQGRARNLIGKLTGKARLTKCEMATQNFGHKTGHIFGDIAFYWQIRRFYVP